MVFETTAFFSIDITEKYVFLDVRKSLMEIKRVNSMVPEEMVSNLDVNDFASPLQSVVKETVKLILAF